MCRAANRASSAAAHPPPSRRAARSRGTAQRRYQFGEYTGVVLGEIESSDAVKYQFILALVRAGEGKPGFYVTAEKNPRSRAHEGSHRLRVITDGLTEEIESSDRWADIDVFCEEAFAVAAKVLGLSGEQPKRLA